jgi:phosphatidate cytidylyltransferase
MITLMLSYIVGFFVIGGVAMYFANRRVDAVTRRARWTKYGVYIVIVLVVIGSALGGTLYFLLLCVLIVGLGAYELICAAQQNSDAKKRLPMLLMSAGIYLVLAGGLLAFAYHTNATTIVWVYLTVAAFDGFSQVTGQLLGRHQLARKISPNKTVEGTLGGLIVAALMAVLLRALPGFLVARAIGVSMLVSLAGLCGDLAASWYKRQHGLKDFGTLLPGHGGVLDRFDSFFAAGTVFWLYSLL